MSVAKDIVRILLERSLYVMRRFPILKPVVWAIASLAPPIRRKVTHFSVVRRESAASLWLQSNNPRNPRLIRLSLRARQIFTDLDSV